MTIPAFRIARSLAFAVLAAVSLLSATQSGARAESADRSLAGFASGTGNIIYLAAAVGLPLARDGREGTVHFLRTTDALGCSLAVGLALKYSVKEERPNHADNQSFPSDHAVAAFSVATAEAQYHPRDAVYWYLGAAAIGQSRVRLRDHYEGDVIAGAAIGYGMTRLELSTPHGLILAPFIAPAQHAAGLTLTAPLR